MASLDKKEYKIDTTFKNYSNITGLKITELDKKQVHKSIDNVKLLLNKYKTYNLEQKKDLIKTMLKKPSVKLPYDGFAIQGNKCTIESLLQKSCEKEKTTIFEKNKLCKNNYPLIKFLSNRKTKNNTKKLLIEILSTEYGELTKAQEHTIKNGKYKYISMNKIINDNISLKNKNINKKLLIPHLKGSSNQINKITNYFSTDEDQKEKYLTQRHYKNSRYINKRNKLFSNNLKNKFAVNNRAETQRVYSNLGFGKTVRLENHEASKANNEILLNRFIRKKYLNLKINEPDFIDNEIINNASKLKFNNNLMTLNTKILTI
jgi:hypothetical protein